MIKFSYRAIKESGGQTTGVLEAASLEEAKLSLTQRNLIPVDVIEKSISNMEGFNLQIFDRVTMRDLILFTRQFSIMVRAGVPMLHLLKVLEEQSDNPRLKASTHAIANDVRDGVNLASAFRKHHEIFSPLYCGMINAGENCGQLDVVMDRLTGIIEHEYKVIRDIKTALRYPLMVVAFLLVAFFVLMSFVIPKFASIYKSAKIELPIPTKICIAMSDFSAEYMSLIIPCIIGVIIMIWLFIKTEKGKRLKDYLLLRTPLIGPLITKSIMSRFSSIFSILIASGVNILQSIEILTQTLDNKIIEEEFEVISDHLKSGGGISEPLRESKYFPSLLACITAVGEETGQMDLLLKEVSTHYDIEVNMAIEKLNDAIPVILTIGLAFIVGFFALAIYLPMWDLTKLIKK